ncbi:hypothetical protein [Desulfobulbus alkaliphilus]|uniref:hypothetical protein n=1 Tax=Desulfobulbus alkaliphilus TaxID=869814 RepID=UPI001963A9E8|nr:hypothetical protein [Desulfobulbus alkaliphilus]MBM9537290.1 hypothetical protein [Desulfobulbus alkaliphilus]
MQKKYIKYSRLLLECIEKKNGGMRLILSLDQQKRRGQTLLSDFGRRKRRVSGKGLDQGYFLCKSSRTGVKKQGTVFA